MSPARVAMEDACVALGSCAAAFGRFGVFARAVTIIASLWDHVQRQLSNDFIGGSLALATASFVTNLVWRLTRHAKRITHDRIFTTYDIPAGTPQYHAALRWLYSQPVVHRASRRLVVNPSGGSTKNTSGANDPDDPLEHGLRTLPMLTEKQTVCVRVGGSLVWVGHGHVSPSTASSVTAASFDQSSLGAMGGGGARGSWYSQLLSGARGHTGLASSLSKGVIDDGSSSHSYSNDSSSVLDDGGNGSYGVDSLHGTHGGVSLRLRVLSRTPKRAVRRILETGKHLGKGTAQRHTQVYMPSTAMSFNAQQGGGGSGVFGGGQGGDGVSGGFSNSTPDGFSGNHFAPRVRPEWMDAGRKPARPVSSVVLKGNAADEIVSDAQKFLQSERWYAERGIPYRRGYLLHGSPGSGKTSLVRAVAGELRLPVYQLPLAGIGVDDESFHRLLNSTARRSVVLLEDVDAAGEAGGSVFFNTKGNTSTSVKEHQKMYNGLTLPGLLAALDGVGAAEGRLLFMTCRDLSSLEPALIRPGRIDIKLGFDMPDAEQAAKLFTHFYKEHGGDERKVRRESKNFEMEIQKGRSINVLAETFAAAVTDKSLTQTDHPSVSSMAALQGLLMLHREDPLGAVRAASKVRDANGKGNKSVVA